LELGIGNWKSKKQQGTDLKLEIGNVRLEIGNLRNNNEEQI
jgi:hypothetical protein